MSKNEVAPRRLYVPVANDKYVVVQEADGRLHALRYGDAWRDLRGDNLVLSLAQELQEVRQQRDELVTALEELLHETDPGTQLCGQRFVEQAKTAIRKTKGE